MTYRHRAQVLNPVTSLTVEQHAEIKKLVLEKALDWSTSDGAYAALVASFRLEVKNYYYVHQRRRCCYCSSELHAHKLTYDAEHILDKSEYLEYMFDEANLAAACKLCNQYKSNKPISASGLRFAELSRDTNDYSIVHPHLDEWSEHLKFDLVGRIVPNDSAKGQETIRICGMSALNAARLADQFAIEDNHEAETALRAFHEVADPVRKRELLDLLGEMAGRYDHPGSRAVLEALEADVQHQALPAVGPAVPRQVDAGIQHYPVAQEVAIEEPLMALPAPDFAPIALLPHGGLAADKNPGE